VSTRRAAAAAAVLAGIAALAAPRRVHAQPAEPEPATTPTGDATPAADPAASAETPTPPAAPDPAAEAAAAAKRASVADLVDVFDDKNRVPENPALDILDANALNVVKPGSVKDLGTDLRALVAGGKIVPQVAVEVSPYALAFGRRTTYEDYRRHKYVSILHRLTVSLATTSVGTGDAAATVGAVGVRVRLIDRSDWRLDDTAVGCALAATAPPKPPQQPGNGGVVVVPTPEDNAAEEAKEAKAIKACFDKARKRVGSWNARQLALGGAISSAFPGGKLAADIRDLSGWISWADKLGGSGLLVVMGKYLFADTRREGELRQPARHSASLAVELERRGSRFGVLGSLGVGRRWSDDGDAMAWVGAWVAQVGGGVQVRVSDGTWVELRASAQIIDGEDGRFVSLANFKWNFDVRPVKDK
jgi:hypothetical protein